VAYEAIGKMLNLMLNLMVNLTVNLTVNLEDVLLLGRRNDLAF
jgi:hypothetical protein